MKTTVTKKEVKVNNDVKAEVKFSKTTFRKRFNEAMQVVKLKSISERWETLSGISWHLGGANKTDKEQFIVDRFMASLMKEKQDKMRELDPSSSTFMNLKKDRDSLAEEKKAYHSFWFKNDIIKDLKDGYHKRDNNGNTIASHVFAMCIVDNAFRLIVAEPQRDKKIAKENPFERIVHNFNSVNECDSDFAMWLNDTKVDPIGYQSKNGRFFKFVVTSTIKSGKNNGQVSGFKLVYADVANFKDSDPHHIEWITLSGAGETKANF